MVPGQRALAGLGLDHRHLVCRGEIGERIGGIGVVHAAAGDDQRPLRPGQVADRVLQLGGIRAGAAQAVNPLAEEILGIVVGLGLHVLAQGDDRGTASGGIGQRGDRLGQRAQDLLRPGNPVPESGDRAEAVIGRDRRVAEILDLLEHRVGPPAGEHVAGQQQHRQPVDMGHRRCRDHVGGAGADRGGARHDLAAVVDLGEGDGGVDHRLLVVGAVGRQVIPGRVQGLAQTGDIAVTENGPDAGEQRHLGAVDVGLLGDEVPDQGLGHGQPHSAHRSLPHL